jgi:hypothetical protein
LATFLYRGYDFLVVNSKLDRAKVAIIAPPNLSSLKIIIKKLKESDYKKIIAIGKEIDYGKDFYKYKNYADVNREFLVNNGIDKDLLEVLYLKNEEKDFALSLANKLNSIDNLDNFNLYIKDIDSRYFIRSLEANTEKKFGVVPINTQGYNNQNWYKSSMGVKNIIFSYLKYFYVTIKEVF